MPSQSWTNRVHFQMPRLLKGVMQKRTLTNVWPLVTITPTWAKLCPSYWSHSGSVRVDDRKNVMSASHAKIRASLEWRFSSEWLDNERDVVFPFKSWVSKSCEKKECSKKMLESECCVYSTEAAMERVAHVDEVDPMLRLRLPCRWFLPSLLE